MKRTGKIFVVSSPSGGGKSSIITRVLKGMRGLSLSVSHTSRPPRPGEKNGVHYHFVDKKEFLALRRGGGFVESVSLHGHLYGTSRRELERLTEAGRDILLDIDVRGAARVLKAFPGAVTVFVLPPSMEVLEERLRRRGSDSEEQVTVRLEAASGEMRAAARYRYLIVNSRLEKAVAEMKAIVTAERLHLPTAAARRLIREFLTPAGND